MLEKTIEISMLYDFYSQLLTEKQQEMIDLYYNQDFSLGEIAEVFAVSRQAVYDTLKRTEKILYEYEEKLKLVQLFTKRSEAIEEVLAKVVRLEQRLREKAGNEEIKAHLEGIKGLLSDMLS
ncbi:putative DNA-binding protein [Alkaliphilus crotonatoxidans]